MAIFRPPRNGYKVAEAVSLVESASGRVYIKLAKQKTE
jgi:hypothetical protein